MWKEKNRCGVSPLSTKFVILYNFTGRIKNRVGEYYRFIYFYSKGGSKWTEFWENIVNARAVSMKKKFFTTF